MITSMVRSTATWLRRRWRVVLATVVVALVVAGLLGHFVVLPALVRRQVTQALQTAGFSQPTFEVASSSLWGATLSDVTLGEDLHLREMGIDYSPGSLMDGRIRGLSLAGVRLRVGIDQGSVDLGVLGDLFAGGSGQSRGAPRAGGLPVESVTLVDSVLTIELPERSIELPVEGRLTDVKPAPQLDLVADVAGHPLKVLVIFNPGGTRILAETLSLDAETLAAVLNAWTGVAPREVSGTLKVRTDLVLSPVRRRLTFELIPSELSIAAAATDSQTPPNPIVVDGVLSGEADFAAAAPTLRVRVENGSLASAAWTLSASGIAGTVQFSDLSPLQTPPEQTLSIARATVGQFELADGQTTFQLADPDRLVIDRMQWDIFDGVLSTADVTVDPSEPAAELTVKVDGMRLEPLLALLAPGKATGEGRITGQVHLAVDWPNVGIGEGRLVASSDGVLRITDEQMLSAVAGQVAPAGSGEAAGEIRQGVVDAFMNMRFDELEANIQEVDGRPVAHIQVIGQGRTGRQQKINYEANVTGLDRLLDALLLIQRRLSEANE